MKLGETLLKKIEERGVTVSHVSKVTGVKQATLHGWSTGRSSYKLADLKKVSSFLEITLHELIFGDVDPLENAREEILIEGDVEVVIRRKK